MKTDHKFVRYVAILFAVSVPFWIAGHYAGALLPKSLPLALPVSALMVFLPAVVALVQVWLSEGRAAAGSLLLRVFDVARVRSPLWLAAAILFMPVVLAVSFGLMTLAGYDMPNPFVPLLALPAMLALFFVAAAGEEIGWQGYAYEALERQYNVLETALLLGAVWAAWHIIPFFQTGHDWEWVVWQCIVTVFLRVVIAWLYAYGGRSVFLAIVFHTMSNASMFLFPNFGSFYDPATAAVVLACATAFLAALWGPRMVEERA